MSKEEREERVVLLHQSITERFHLDELDESFCLHRTWKAKKKKETTPEQEWGESEKRVREVSQVASAGCKKDF